MAGEGGSNADVKIKLVVDDGETGETIDRMRNSLKGTHEDFDKGKEKAEGIGKELLKAEIYVESLKEGAELLAEGFHQAWELGEKLADSSVEAADEMNKQVRLMSGLTSYLDAGAHSMSDLRDYTGEVREQLSHAGTAAGVSTAQMTDMFDSIIERGTESTKQAET